MSAAALEFENISFNYGKSEIIKNFSLVAEQGRITTLLGPSGCGKTTLLKLAAGFLKPSDGNILINGNVQNNIPANKRNIAYVFQDYALFPHMTVEKNILYGLKIQGEKKEKDFYRYKLEEKLRLLGLVGFEKRFPHELSGGQQQRVALARSLILDPEILLMDEPLSSLDAKLRCQLRQELKELQQRLGITTVYVTHDQEEALELSDTIAVIDHGKLLQKGNGQDVYCSPKSKLVADFTGTANYFESSEVNKNIMVRNEWFTLKKKDGFSITGTVVDKCFMGSFTRLKVKSLIARHGMFSVDLKTSETEKINCGDVAVFYAESFMEYSGGM